MHSDRTTGMWDSSGTGEATGEEDGDAIFGPKVNSLIGDDKDIVVTMPLCTR
jgi:hypothetical protein